MSVLDRGIKRNALKGLHFASIQAMRFRQGMGVVLHGATPPEPNQSKFQASALKRLREDESICVLPTDKGVVTVVMDKVNYAEAALSLLGDTDTYEEVPPTVVRRFVVQTKWAPKIGSLRELGPIRIANFKICFRLLH